MDEIQREKRLHARRVYKRTSDIVSCIVQATGMDEYQAIHDFYNSQTYELLANEQTKFWWLSTPAILDVYRAETELEDISLSPYVDGLV